MVKGVKRNIIEVNNTGSDCFERIVFYISPDFPLDGKNVADLATAELKKIVNGTVQKKSLRYRIKEKKKRKALLFFSGAVLLVVAAVMIKLLI